MYKGDRSRKENLVMYGFRLPSALDNRPLRFEEFERLMPQSIFVSATPGPYEDQHAGDVIEQGDAESIFSNPQQGYTKELLSAAFDIAPTIKQNLEGF